MNVNLMNEVILIFMTREENRLTSAEITELWMAYMNDSALFCKLSYFLNKAEDVDVQPLITKTTEIIGGHLQMLENLFIKESFSVPVGFNLQEDVDVDAPRLFSDSYVLFYLQEMSRILLQSYGVSLSFATRDDVYQYFQQCVQESMELLQQTNEILIRKGLYIKPPYLPQLQENDFVKKQNFLTGYFGERRPLSGPEITNLFANFQRNAMGACTMIGFSQVAKTTDVRRFMERGKKIAMKHCEIFESIMKEDDVPVPGTWDTEVTDSTSFTFSDKLMMYYTTSLISLSIGYYGSAMAVSPRRDLGTTYNRLLNEILKYSEDGTNIMIQHGWLEEPPRALDRKELARRK